MTVVLENFKSEIDALAHFRANNFDLIESENGNFTISDFPVFRTGTFKDSMGESRTWSKEHLAQLVSNFNLLRDQQRLEDVPVRDGHPNWLGSSAPGSGPGRVVGYVSDLRVGDANVDGESMLIADFEFTEPDAAEKFERGTFRARSSEIGMYETNDEELHWPVFLGFAFVDIGAVEKLFGRSSLPSNHYTLSEDTEMGTKPKGDETIDLSTTENEDGGAGESEEEEETTSTDTHTHSKGSDGPFMFRVNGVPTQDFMAVQQHIENLEAIQSEMVESSRNEFVNSLANDNKIAATQIESMQELVSDMNVDQYNKFVAMYKNAPSNALFAKHAEGITNEDGTEGTEESTEPDEMEILELRVEHARKSGLGEEAVQKMASYQRLQKLKASQE